MYKNLICNVHLHPVSKFNSKVSKDLICLPVSEEVDGPVHAPLDDRPAAGVVSLLTPDLHQFVDVLRLHQIHAALCLAFL